MLKVKRSILDEWMWVKMKEWTPKSFQFYAFPSDFQQVSLPEKVFCSNTLFFFFFFLCNDQFCMLNSQNKQNLQCWFSVRFPYTIVLVKDSIFCFESISKWNETNEILVLSAWRALLLYSYRWSNTTMRDFPDAGTMRLILLKFAV